MSTLASKSMLSRAFKSVPLLVGGAYTAMGMVYVFRQLRRQSNNMDHIFEPYHSDKSEAVRKEIFKGEPDPRTNLLNILSWK